MGFSYEVLTGGSLQLLVCCSGGRSVALVSSHLRGH